MLATSQRNVTRLVMCVALLTLIACLGGQAVASPSSQPDVQLTTTIQVETVTPTDTPRPYPLTATAYYLTQQPILGATASASVAYADASATALAEFGSPTAEARQTQVSQALDSLAPMIPQRDLDSDYLLDWPVPPFTLEQLVEVQSCDMTLAITLNPQSTCAWATIAAAYLAGIPPGEHPPELGRQAFAQAVLRNPAFAFADSLFYGYFDTIRLVEPPPAASRNPVIVVLTFSLSAYEYGLDGRTAYTILITDATTAPQVSGRVVTSQNAEYAGLHGHPDSYTSTTFSQTVPVESVQALLGGLSDLMPISPNPRHFDMSYGLPRCQEVEPSPHWAVTLYFADHTRFTMGNFGSAYLVDGGPWATVINDQYYLQYSSAFLLALSDLAESLDLPVAPTDNTLVTETGCDLGPNQQPSVLNDWFRAILFED